MHFHCDKCGDSQTALLNGFRFAGEILEGVFFDVEMDTKGAITKFDGTEDSKPFLRTLSMEKWIKQGREVAQTMIEEDDQFTCKFCKENVTVDED